MTKSEKIDELKKDVKHSKYLSIGIIAIMVYLGIKAHVAYHILLIDAFFIVWTLSFVFVFAMAHRASIHFVKICEEEQL